MKKIKSPFLGLMIFSSFLNAFGRIDQAWHRYDSSMKLSGRFESLSQDVNQILPVHIHGTFFARNNVRREVRESPA
jgi:hypothetical protein